MKKLEYFIYIFVLCVSVQIQAQEFSIGCIYDEETDGLVPLRAHLLTRDYTEMPKAYSLKKYCPKPNNQEAYGTCVGWSTAYAARTICEAIANGWTDKAKITQEAFAPIFIYKQIQPQGNCQQGSSIASALELLKVKGVPKFSSFNVWCCDYIPQVLYAEAVKYKIDGYSKLFDRHLNLVIGGVSITDKIRNLNLMKKAISQNHPVIIGMDCYSSFSDVTNYWNGKRDNLRGGHAMCVVAYDDNMYGGAFQIMNSWGNDWGNEGFVWVKYDDFFQNVKYAYDIFIKKKDIPNPQPIIPNPTPIPIKKNTFAGEMYIKEKDGGEQMALSLNTATAFCYYKTKDAYLSGKKFRLYVSNNEPAWVYVIASDQTNNVTKLFPYSDKISALLDYKQNNIAIPDESHEFQFDTIAGTDYFLVLYSAEELAINDIISKIKNTSGSFYQKVASALGPKLAPKADIKYIQNKMGFSSKTDGRVVPLVVEVTHK